MFKTINPATGEELSRFPFLSPDDLRMHLEHAQQAFASWRTTPLEKRREAIGQIADLLLIEKATLSKTMTTEMGKPLVQAEGEIEKCAWLCRFYAQNAADFLAPKTIEAGYEKSYVRYDPVGGVLGIMPWNFPFWQAFRFAIPAILAGNVALLKPAPNVPQCGRHVERLLAKAIPTPHVFQTLFVDTEQVEHIVAHDLVQGVALTGSDRAGSAVAALAGKYLKKCVMELGGSDAFIVLDDANVHEAARVAVQSRMNNSGQTCIAAKRFIVAESIYEAFAAAVVDEVRGLAVDDPFGEDTDIGPLARPDLRANLNEQVEESLKQGADILYAGEQPVEEGSCYFSPVVLSNIQPGSPAYDQELFGPVACLFKVKDDKEAMALANDTQYGLGAAIWSADTARAERVAGELSVGAISINGMVKSDPHLPFGGVKHSGFGRELGRHGLLEFVNVKSVVVNK